MPVLNSVQDVISYAVQLVQPFVSGNYVVDWEQRAAALSLVSDYLIIRLRDDAFVEEQILTYPVEPEADVGHRGNLAGTLRNVVSGKTLTLPGFAIADDKDMPALLEICSTLDYSEKIVMSVAAYALDKLSLSPELFSVIANILFEEAYHLKIVTSLLGLDQPVRAWISADKVSNWQLVRACEDGSTYMLIEHLLFEGRGGIAAARGLYEAKIRGVSERPMLCLEKICNQETNHGIAGLLWFGRDNPNPKLSRRARSLVRRFLEQECDDTSGSFRSLRQRYSAWLLNQYLNGSPINELVVSLKRDVVLCKTEGNIKPQLSDVSRGVESLYDLACRNGD